MQQKDNIFKLPIVSIVMPIRNEAAFIERSLGSVLSQSYPSDLLEIVVADGQSTDATRDLIEKLKTGTNVRIKVVDNPKRIMPTGLNLAIEESVGDVVIVMGGHCEFYPDYVENCVKHLQEEKAEGVGGPIETIGETLQAQTIAAAMSSRFGVGGSAFRTIDDREIYVDTVAFTAYKREMLQKAGAFDEELVRDQDDEYNYRIRKLGGRILLTPDIRSRYYNRGTLRSLWRQYFQYGFYKVRVLQLHPLQMQPRQFIPSIFVLALLASLTGAIFHITGALIFGFIFGAYLFANLFASIKVASGHGIRHLPYLPLCFFILHFSYGLGFLYGLIYFVNRWGEKPGYQLSSSDV